jgi:multidrug resistance efflux pump
MPNVPWNLLLNQLPTMMRAVDTLIETTSRRNAARDTGPAIESLQRRVAALEDEQRMSAELLKQLTEHIGAVEAAAQAAADTAAATLRRAMIVAAVAGVIAVVAVIIGVMSWVRG